MSKQSSVEWLFDWIEANMHEDNFNILSAKETAIRMEKEQIIKTYRDGRSDQQSQKEARFYNRNAEYYYNEQYGGNNE